VSSIVNEEGLDMLFRKARTHRHWTDEPVDDALLRQLHDLFKLGPTAGNSCPARIVFVKSKEAKERLRPALDEGNVTKTMTAPVTAIIGHDLEFYELMRKLAPHVDARSTYVGDDELIR
jgi:3-hydroxypropanoate dehydrogenase